MLPLGVFKRNHFGWVTKPYRYVEFGTGLTSQNGYELIFQISKLASVVFLFPSGQNRRSSL